MPLIEKALAKAAQEGIGEQHQLERLVRAPSAAGWGRDAYRRSPIVLPIIIDA